MRMVEAMRNGDLRKQSEWERKITEIVNAEKAGALGLCGDHSALGTFLNILLYGPVEFESYVQGLAVVWSRDGQRFPLILRVRLRSDNMFS